MKVSRTWIEGLELKEAELRKQHAELVHEIDRKVIKLNNFIATAFSMRNSKNSNCILSDSDVRDLDAMIHNHDVSPKLLRFMRTAYSFANPSNNDFDITEEDMALIKKAIDSAVRKQYRKRLRNLTEHLYEVSESLDNLRSQCDD